MYGAASGLLSNGVPPSTAFPPTSMYPNGMSPYGAPYGMRYSDFEDANETTIIKDISKEMMEKGEASDEGSIMDLMPSKKVIWGLFACLLVPLCLFIVVYYARVMWIHYQYPWLSTLLAAWCFILVLCSGAVAYGIFAKKMKRLSLGAPNINLLLFFSCLGAWLLGFYGGDWIFEVYTKPYYDLAKLATHKQVNPHETFSQSLMDAGIIEFTKDATLDLDHQTSFKNNDIYCIAPITTKGDEAKSDSCISFWAVGINCCSKEKYECGEYKNPIAHSGVRLMNEDHRDFFALAVEKAAAAYELNTCPQPMFVHWLEKPSHEIEGMREDYTHAFGSGILAYLCFQLVLLIVLTIAFAKLSP